MVKLQFPAQEKLNFISAIKAARLLGITSRRLRVLANEGRIKHAYLDKEKGWQFPKSDIEISPGARGPAFGLKKTK